MQGSPLKSPAYFPLKILYAILLNIMDLSDLNSRLFLLRSAVVN